MNLISFLAHELKSTLFPLQLLLVNTRSAYTRIYLPCEKLIAFVEYILNCSKFVFLSILLCLEIDSLKRIDCITITRLEKNWIFFYKL